MHFPLLKSSYEEQESTVQHCNEQSFIYEVDMADEQSSSESSYNDM